MKFLYILGPLMAMLAGQYTGKQSEVPPLDIIPIVHNAVHQEVRTSVDGQLTELLSSWEQYAENPDAVLKILIQIDDYNKGVIGKECNILYPYTFDGPGGGVKPPKKGPGKPFPCPEENKLQTIPRISVRTSALLLRSHHQDVAFYLAGELVGATAGAEGENVGGVVIKTIDTSGLQPGKGEIAFLVAGKEMVRLTVEYVDY